MLFLLTVFFCVVCVGSGGRGNVLLSLLWWLLFLMNLHTFVHTVKRLKRGRPTFSVRLEPNKDDSRTTLDEKHWLCVCSVNRRD